MPLTTFDLKLQSTRMLTPSVLHLNFVMCDGDTLDFIPGQFITFLLDQNGKTVRRSYSLASVPGQNHAIEIAISPIVGGLATDILFNLEIGQILTASGPFGRMVLPEQTPSHTLLVATSTGVSPYRAMLTDIAQRLAKHPASHVSLLLGVQYRHDLLYGEEFIRFAKQHERFNFYAYLSRELKLEHDYERAGYVQTGFESLNLNPETDIIFLCGNPNMIDAAFAWLREAGFSPRSVKREKYISSNKAVAHLALQESRP